MTTLPQAKVARTRKHRAALGYGAKVPVFPCKVDKTPYTPHGHLDATTDQARINAYWNRYPDANPAMPTGRRSGVCVLDVDKDKWGFGNLEALVEEHGELPATFTVKTGGGGLHYYFWLPADTEIRNSAGKLGQGLDVRGEGGYVLLPGSTTEGDYEVLENPGIAEAPTWLVELLREPDVSPIGNSARRRSTTSASANDPILEGVRNQTLFFIALDLKDSGKGREEALAELLGINEARCSPPLEATEVEGIVKSAFRYPIRGKRTPPEVLEALGELKRAWWATAWRGVGGKSDRDILRVLIQFAERYGQLIPAGVRVSISYRTLALASGCALKTVERAIKRLRVRSWLRGDHAQRSGTRSGAFVLLPRQTDDTQSMVGAQGPGGDGSVVTLSRLPELTPCFRWRGFVGKGKAGALYVLEVFGPQGLEELAKRLGFSRRRDLRRLYLEPLAELGLIEDRGGVYALPARGYAERVEDIRNARYGGGPRKIRRKDLEGRWVSRVVEVPPMSELERREADREEYKKQSDKYRNGGVRPTLHVANVGADGFAVELERVPELDEGLRDALRNFLRRNPHRKDEAPSWLSVALWAEEYTPSKAPPVAVELALAELQGAAA
jgi:hypothetical protein